MPSLSEVSPFYGWEKYFLDGSCEVGADEDVRNHKASWSKGRLADIEAVYIYGPHKVMAMVRSGLRNEWWQADDLVARYSGPGTVEAQYIKRRIMYLIQDRDIDDFIIYPLNPERPDNTDEFGRAIYQLHIGKPFSLPGMCYAERILPQHVGLWLAFEYDLPNDCVRYSIGEYHK